MQELQFDYFRGGEAEQFSFYRVPKVLFTAECFKNLSCEAKVLYGLMLDRMGLSIKNRWFDEEDRVYIVFTVEEIMELLNCKSQKATKLIKELDMENGIGLIEKKRLGLGKPNVIYVKNFMIRESAELKGRLETEGVLAGQNAEDAAEHKELCGVLQNFENQKSRVLKIKDQEFRESKIKNFENQKSGVLKIENQEFRESKIRSFENQNSGSMKIKNQEFRKSNSNNTDINDTEKNDTISSYLSFSEQGMKEDPMDMMDAYRGIVRKNISYDALVHDAVYSQEQLDELVELIVEVMMLPDEMPVRIAGSEKLAAVIKSRFMKLTMMHITYVLECLRGSNSKIGNIKAYILTALYNATMTMEHYYQAEVGHDFHGS
ncbi:DUF6017 domain-containing protein [Ruminococcus sp. 5_1_39BFAA]|uniref:DUF6017 domain-containing protein n=1 Tax=Ruminococcus sp. 5_1_39BFAA TaxID=457412 RepID=UPI003566CA73